MTIRVLSDQLSSQIAAGEVVERPFSVVKELVENALDAGASTINVDIREGGRELIQVADDGVGIVAEELEIAFQRHTTSKLAAVEDLEAILTLGFRGEALAAIAAVSRLTVVSRAEISQTGTRLVLEGGRKVDLDTVGAPKGTFIAVENLFFNVPARMKFMKSVVAERRQIDEFLTRFALAYPKVRFRLAHNNRISFQVSGSGHVPDVLLAIYGPETARQLLAIDENHPAADQDFGEGESRLPIVVTGYVSPPSLHWANRNHITLFVNGRLIKDKALTHAVTQAYHTLLPVGRYPLGIIFITISPDQVDVNVHPAKTEVRFRFPNMVFGAVQRQVRQTLLDQSPIPTLRGWPSGEAEYSGEGWTTNGVDPHAFTEFQLPTQDQFSLVWPQPHVPEEMKMQSQGNEPFHVPPDENNPASHLLENERLPMMRVIGQIGAAYLITEGPQGMYLIDQHAAHERILFEQFMAQRNQEGIVSQGLVTGVAVHLPPSQAFLLEENLGLLNSLGFQLETFGPNVFMIRSVPAITANINPEKALRAVMDDLEAGESPMYKSMEEKIITRVCKSAAIKAGQMLSRSEMEAMVQQLEACRSPFTCPHGRPTLIHLSATQLARQFGRT